jgi:transcriptional regulator NrdR family protein
MRCINCGEDTKITETRVNANNEPIRQHKCLKCNTIFFTKEQVVPYEEISTEINAVRNAYKKDIKNFKVDYAQKPNATNLF